MKRYFYLGLIVMLMLIIGLVTYGAYLNQRDEAQISERMSERTIPLQGSKAKIRNISANIMLEGVNLYSDDKTDVIALIEGRITDIGVQKNDHVRKGEVLFVLTNEQYPIKIRQAEIDILRAEGEIIRADNDIRKAETELAHAKSNFNRYDQLRDYSAISLEKYEEMEAIYKESQITLENMYLQKNQMIEQKKSLEAQKEQLLIESAYSRVEAPIDGEVLILYKQIGAYVAGGTALALIGNFNNLYISTPMEDKEIRKFSVGQEAVLSFNQKEFQKVYDIEYEAGNKGNLQTFNARIVEISPSLDQSAAIRKVIWQVDNSSGLLEPQTYGNVTFEMKSMNRCLTVPLSAMADVTNTSVFVWTADGTIQRRNVTTGIKDGKYIEIVSGLKEGEVVITSGTNGLEGGMKASVTFKSEED
ncbi:MAG: efflux RND transporter periplasmic adaptor subunit [Selenomonadaceae bacterium]|nr:efflux RND transporter periplasmic adaptor subunit [Selenomonadaceae bacterium]